MLKNSTFIPHSVFRIPHSPYLCCMEIIIGITAFLASLLTLFSGFGLGTLLTPVFGLFFPAHIAVALTGIVHLLNNLFKVSLLGKQADKKMVFRFGIPSVLGGLLGAWLLLQVSELSPIARWQLGERVFEIAPLKLLIGVLMIFFALMEVIPSLKKLQFGQQYLSAGGLLSGFFGGLSGHQGALRSAFLLKSGLDKTAFVATGIMIACMVDLTRLPVYFSRMRHEVVQEQWSLLLIATICAFAGAWLGTRFLKKTTYTFIKWSTTVMILVIGVLMGSGVL